MTMKGKERDLKLANNLRETFISTYSSNESAFQGLLSELGDNCLERLIYRLKGEHRINLYRDYNALKEVAEEVRSKQARKVFELVCKVDEARAWINDNGKYTSLAFEALYNVFKEEEQLKAFIETEDSKILQPPNSLTEEALEENKL